jgi:hypothetical protein
MDAFACACSVVWHGASSANVSDCVRLCMVFWEVPALAVLFIDLLHYISSQ